MHSFTLHQKCLFGVNYSKIHKACSASNASYFIMLVHDIRGRSWTLPPIFHYMLLPCDRWQLRGMLLKWSLTEKCVEAKVCHVPCVPPHGKKKRHSLTYTCWKFMETKLNVSTVRQWAVCFSSGGSDMKDKPRFGCHTTKWRSIRILEQTASRELCMELNIGFMALEKMMVILGYCKICARWVP